MKNFANEVLNLIPPGAILTWSFGMLASTPSLAEGVGETFFAGEHIVLSPELIKGISMMVLGTLAVFGSAAVINMIDKHSDKIPVCFRPAAEVLRGKIQPYRSDRSK